MYFFILRKQYFLANFVKKNPFDLNIFLSHMKYGRKIKNEMNFTQMFNAVTNTQKQR